MSNYTQITFFAPKDALLSGNPAKLIKGADVDPELAAIATAIASKYDATNFAFANPSAAIGLAVVNGSATTPMRSDAAPALSQAISPTWSGTHTFTNAITVNGAGTSLKGGVTVAAPASGNALTVNTVAGANAITVTPGAVASVAYGFSTNGGTGIWSSASSNVDIATASSNRVNINSTGNVTINVPSSGTALSITGANGVPVVSVIGSSGGAGQSFGKKIQAGTNSTDYNLALVNQSNTVNYFQVRGDGVVFGNDGTNLLELGYKDVPINTQSTNYTLVAADRGKMVQTGASATYTLNTGVFGGGAAVTLRAASGATLTVAQGAGFTLSWAGNGATTGNRTLTGEAIATLIYTGANAASISGAGVS